MAQIEKSTFKFLKDIAKNNNREWFNSNKDYYKEAHENVKSFLSALEIEMNKTDVIEKAKLFRIYRDVRFSKDKTPYKSHFALFLKREGAFRRGGYYLGIQPGNSMIAGGFWKPESKDLKLIRDHISADHKPLMKILKAKKFKDLFGQLEGEQLKKIPRGFDADHPAADLLRHKQFLVHRKMKDSDVTSPQFLKEVVKSWKGIRPYFDYMSDILTHDLDGVPLYAE